jgi:serine/threonine protein phosphatase PrpC
MNARTVVLSLAACGGAMLAARSLQSARPAVLQRPLEWAAHSIQGHRDYQEDRYIGDDATGLFAVFDGHGGALTSETAKNTFAGHWKELRSGGVAPASAWPAAFKATEESYKKVSANVPDTGGSMRSHGREGSTACAAFVSDTHISVANAGDSRCVLCRNNGQAIAMSVDHKPTDAPELERLTKHGFKVVRGRIYEVATGKGGLNLSRALGDLHYREGVPCEPDVQERAIDPALDELLILATDGLWDVVSNEKACQLALSESSLQKAAQKLVTHAFDNHSGDNITALVVRLPRQQVNTKS